MQNLYNKGRFRSYEYGKIPPYLKKLGNKRWRRSATIENKALVNEAHSLDTKVQIHKKSFKKSNSIKIKITFINNNGIKSSTFVKYKNTKALNDSIKRNNVINVVFK